MDSIFFKIGEAFKAITRSVFPDRSFSGPWPENGGVDVTKSHLLFETPDFTKGMALNGRWIFGSVLKCTKLVVAVLKIRVSVVRFRDWPPLHFKKPLIVLIEGFFLVCRCVRLV